MIHLLVRYDVRDYATWRKHFDADLAGQRKAGIHMRYVFRDEQRRSSVTMLFHIEDRMRALAYMCREGADELARKAGVHGRIENHWLTEG